MTTDATASAGRQPVSGDDDARDEDGDRAKQVAGDLEIGAAHGQALALACRQEAQRGEVRDQGEGGNDGDHGRLDVRRVGEPADRLDPDHDRDPEQQDGVDGGGDHLEPVQAERPGIRGRPGRDPDRDE